MNTGDIVCCVCIVILLGQILIGFLSLLILDICISPFFIFEFLKKCCKVCCNKKDIIRIWEKVCEGWAHFRTMTNDLI